MSGAIPLRRIAVFCGSSPGNDPRLAEAARELARLLAGQGVGVVYGGASCGLMGLLADAALADGGEVIGVLPRSLQDRELAHQGLTELHIVETMHARKQLMADLADGFIALPGGFGTLDEFCEILTWAQLGIHAKPCGLLNVGGFFDPFLAQVETAVNRGLTRPAHRELILDGPDAASVLSRMSTYRPPANPTAKWLEAVRP